MTPGTDVKRYPKALLLEQAKANPATEGYAFGERSGGYTISVPTLTPSEIRVRNEFRARWDSPNVYVKTIGTLTVGQPYSDVPHAVVNVFQLTGVGRDIARQQNVIVLDSGEIIESIDP